MMAASANYTPAVSRDANGYCRAFITTPIEHRQYFFESLDLRGCAEALYEYSHCSILDATFREPFIHGIQGQLLEIEPIDAQTIIFQIALKAYVVALQQLHGPMQPLDSDKASSSAHVLFRRLGVKGRLWKSESNQLLRDIQQKKEGNVREACSELSLPELSLVVKMLYAKVYEVVLELPPCELLQGAFVIQSPPRLRQRRCSREESQGGSSFSNSRQIPTVAASPGVPIEQLQQAVHRLQPGTGSSPPRNTGSSTPAVQSPTREPLLGEGCGQGEIRNPVPSSAVGYGATGIFARDEALYNPYEDQHCQGNRTPDGIESPNHREQLPLDDGEPASALEKQGFCGTGFCSVL